MEFHRAVGDAVARGVSGRDVSRLHGVALLHGLTEDEERWLPAAVSESALAQSARTRADLIAPSPVPLLSLGNSYDSLGQSDRLFEMLEGLPPCWRCFQDFASRIPTEMMQMLGGYVSAYALRVPERGRVIQAFFDRSEWEGCRRSIFPNSRPRGTTKNMLILLGSFVMVIGIIAGISAGSMRGDGSGAGLLVGIIFGGMGGLVLLGGMCMQVHACGLRRETERLELEYAQRHGGCSLHPLAV
ncbi:MAG: hypothetical protein LBB14_03770 [Puniceicoccales bacterium]|jgi:hypothetical protein|nr:hypothetical protein [Puniceicoccales bacterium]